MSKIDKFKFNPSQGFTDSNAYPNPVDEESVREQLQRPHNQTRDYINRLTTLLEEKGASFIATSDGKTVEQALEEIAESLGVSDYKDLSNKPSINGVELNGDASLDDLGLTDAIERSTIEALTEAKESGMFNGSDGYTPVKGEDYFTEEDKDEIANEAIAKLPLASYENYGLVKVDSRTAASDNYVTVTHARDAGRNEAYFVPTIKRFNNKPSTLNANFLPVATPSSNGAMSKEDKAKLDAFKEASEYLTSVKWEDIENQPFYKIENGDTLTWDGNTSGLEVVGNMYKVSNATPTASDFDKGCTLYGFLYGNTTVERDITELIKKEQPKGYHQYNADILAMGLYVIVAYNDCIWLGNSYTKGTWFMYMPDSTLVTRLTIDEYTGFGVIKQLDSEFVDAYTKGETNKLIEDAKNELNTTITNERTDLHLEIVVAKNELNTKIDNTKNELTTSIENTKTELNTKIDSLDLGVDSWNELEDKPFGSTYSNTLTWDGKTDGLERVEIGVDYYFYHVSNDVFTSDDISNGISYLIRDDNAGTTTSSNRNFTVYDGILMVEGYFIACVENDNTTYSHMTFPKKGTYFASGQGQTTISLTVNGYDGFEIIDAIDEKYLPKHTHDYLPITGGTIVSGSTTPLVIESTQDDFNFIGFNDHESNEVGRIGFYNGKPSVNVDNTVAEILHTSNYESYITGFAELNHTHLNATDSRNGFMSAGDKSKLDSVNDTFAQKEHTHNNYSLTSHTHSEYANKEHTHSQYLTEHQDLSDYALKSELPTDYAKKEHTHSEYSPTNHTHDGLMSKEDKLKLNSIEEYAEKNIVIEVSDNLVVSNGIWLMTYYDAESNTNKQIFAPVVTENKIARGLLPLATTTEDGAMSSTDKVKLNGIEDGANKYVHPSTHDASMITQDSTHRFVTDTEKSTWNNKASKSVATTSANGLMSASDKAKLDSVNNTFAPKEHTHPYVSSMNVNGVTLTYNKGDGTTGSVNLPSGASSWNDLEDKPFGEVASDTLTWDGNTEGKASVYIELYNATLYHVSNSAPTVSDLTNGGTYALNVFTPTDFDTSDFLPASPFIIFDGGAIFIALEDASYNNQQVIKGTYLVNDRGAYVKSFKVNGYTGFTGIKTIDEKYLPEGIGTGGDIDLSDYQTKTDSTLATSDKTVVGAINEVNSNKVDKVSGKGLSTNDLTANLKSNYDSAYSHTLNKSNPHGVTLSQLGVNATATELNYVDGVTSSIQTQLDNKAPSTHTHPYVSSMSVSGSTLKYTKGDGTTGSVNLPSGGASSWNDLEDKPFGEALINKLDMLTAKETTKIYLEGIPLKLYKLQCSSINELDGLQMTLMSTTMEIPLPTTFTWDNTAYVSDPIGENVTLHVCDEIIFIIEISSANEFGVENGLYCADYFGAMCEMYGEPLPEVNYYTSTTPIFVVVNYFPNEYLDFMNVQGHEAGEVLTWNGDGTNRDKFNDYYKMSDVILTQTELSNGGTIVVTNVENGEELEPTTINFTNENIVVQGDAFTVAGVCVIGHLFARLYGISTGIYFYKGKKDGTSTDSIDEWVSSFQVNGYTFPESKTYKIKSNALSNVEANNLIYPLGTILCTSTNTAPKYDGTWELIDKEFKSKTKDIYIGATSEEYATNVIAKATLTGHTTTVYLQFKCAQNITKDTPMFSIANLQKSGLGITKFSQPRISNIVGTTYGSTFIRTSTSGYLDSDTYLNLYFSSIMNIENIESPILAKENDVMFNFSFTSTHDNMIDNHCDKFYWKRTA